MTKREALLDDLEELIVETLKGKELKLPCISDPDALADLRYNAQTLALMIVSLVERYDHPELRQRLRERL